MKRRSDTLECDIQLLKVERRLLPDFLIPFGVTPGGDYYCFSSRDSDFGAIYLHFMDVHDASRTTRYLAAPLNVFLDKLTTKIPPKRSVH